jgi:diacylglycerol diphosphate phosphatase/phosphatidate phosphatase
MLFVAGLFTAVLLTAAITDSVKDGIGRPRPDFYARCFGSVNGTALYDVTGNVICTGSTAVMREAYKSFPSGHTSCKSLLSIPPVLTGLLHM